MRRTASLATLSSRLSTALLPRTALPRAAHALAVARRSSSGGGSGSITNDATSAEWAAAGLGVVHADPAREIMNRLMFVQVGFGVDQHGDRRLGSTKAAMRALRDAISFNSIPGMVSHVPGGRANMLIHVRLGVPSEYPEVDEDALAACFPYGRLLPIEVVPGGLTFGSGRVVTELGDEDDTAIVACAAVSLGYHDASDASTAAKAWDTRDGH